MPSAAYIAVKRFFVELPERFESFPADVETCDETTVHHLRNVVRARINERVVLVDDRRELAYAAVIREIQKASVVFSVEAVMPAPSKPLPTIMLAVALVKEQRWDWILQKSTELGVRTIQPLMGDHSVVRVSDSDRKTGRWQAIVRSAAEQSEGLFIPDVAKPLTVKAFCVQPQSGTVRILLSERGDERLPLKQLLPQIKPEQTVVFAIGPEGGWSDAEIAAFQQAGFVSTVFGDRILRSETAATAAISALIYETMH